MSKTSTHQPTLTSALDKLTIAPTPSVSKADPITDSWDDEDVPTPASDLASPLMAPIIPTTSKTVPAPPPPTPASPGLSNKYPLSYSSLDASQSAPRASPLSTPRGSRGSSPVRTEPQSGSGRNTEAPEKRPEKSTAVASRLIAAGLGVRAPKRTEEQKEYDRAVRAQERKRKEREIQEEKKRKEEAERAKVAIWED